MTIVIPTWMVWVGIGFMLISIVQSIVSVRLARKQIDLLLNRRRSVIIKSDPDDLTHTLVTELKRPPIGEKRRK